MQQLQLENKNEYYAFNTSIIIPSVRKYFYVAIVIDQCKYMCNYAIMYQFLL